MGEISCGREFNCSSQTLADSFNREVTFKTSNQIFILEFWLQHNQGCYDTEWESSLCLERKHSPDTLDVDKP